MYVSGSLKNRTVQFYKETMFSLDGEGFQNDQFYFGFDGSITAIPFADGANALEAKMDKRQEELIHLGVKKTFQLVRQRNMDHFSTHREINRFTIANNNYAYTLISEEINRLRDANRNYAYALFECFYTLIKTAKNYAELSLMLENFRQFRKYVDGLSPITQADLDIMIELFKEGKSYTREDILKRKSKKFHIEDISNLSEEVQSIISLGEFIAPIRLPNIARDLQNNNEFSRLVAPIYFALKDNHKSELFLRSCRTTQEIDYEFIRIKCILHNIPDNILGLVRKKN